MEATRFLSELLDSQQSGNASTILTATLDGELQLIDPIDGGVFRYSETPNWRSPRYERLLDIQAMALGDYSRAFHRTGDARYRRAAERVQEYTARNLKLANGLYAVAQSADIQKPDGSWIEGRRYFGMTRSQRSVVGRPNVSSDEYADSNAHWAVALLLAGQSLSKPEWQKESLSMMDQLWRSGVHPNGAVRHRLNGPGIEGLLQDQLAVADAEFIGFRLTHQSVHVERVNRLMGFMDHHLADRNSGGYRRGPDNSNGQGPERTWEALDPDLTASAAILWNEMAVAGSKTEASVRAHRVTGWVAARPELIQSSRYARLALRQ
jgi:uncharacterized protein YyaL (SSP411 family)